MSQHEIFCSGKNCCKSTKDKNANVELRHDAYGIPTRYYCQHCYDNNYPYRKDRYYDFLNAGEYMDDDY